MVLVLLLVNDVHEDWAEHDGDENGEESVLTAIVNRLCSCNSKACEIQFL